MDVTALVLWVIAAGGGFVMLGMWATKRNQEGTAPSRIGPGPILTHFLLAAIGLVIWIVYTFVSDTSGLAWAALAILVVVAALGFTMFGRWLSDRREPTDPQAENRPEQRFPVAVVGLHGLFAAATLVVVLLVALGVAS